MAQFSQSCFVNLGQTWQNLRILQGSKDVYIFLQKSFEVFSLRSIWTPSFVDINRERNNTFICPVHGAKLRGAKACPQLRLYCNRCSCYSELKTSFSCFSFPSYSFLKLKLPVKCRMGYFWCVDLVGLSFSAVFPPCEDRI